MIIEHSDAADSVLEHFGIKGMHWGQRKAEGSAGGGAPKPKKTFRGTTVEKMNGREIRIEKDKFYEDKANDVLKRSAKGDGTDALVSVTNRQTYATTIITGRELVEHMGRGGLMDIYMTDIYAEKNADGVYEMTEGNRVYKRSDKIARDEAKATRKNKTSDGDSSDVDQVKKSLPDDTDDPDVQQLKDLMLAGRKK